MTRWMWTLTLTAGCLAGAIEVDTDGTDDTDVVDTDVTAPPNPFAGDYEGDVNIMNESWGFRLCQGDAFAIEIDDDGELTGEGVCTGQTWGGGEQPYDVEIVGQVDPVTGGLTAATVTFQVMGGGGGGGGGELMDIEADVVGNADNADVEADWTVEVEGGGGGPTTYSGEINTWPN